MIILESISFNCFDISDKYRAFDIGLGVTSKGSFKADSFYPYNSSVFENASVVFNYSGVTTRVLSDDIISGSIESGQVEMLLNTQRESSQGSADNTSKRYQEIKLDIIKENGVWKVDNAIWL